MMKVLVVDDTASDRKLLRYTLEKHGCESIIEAGDGQEGIDLARAHRPDLIISDALMPRMDGFQFLRAVKKDATLRAIPFVFHSSIFTGLKDEDLAFSLGAEAFIAKPKSPDEFWRELTAILKGHKEGKSAPARKMVEAEQEYLKEYGQVVAAKLEEKVKELEETLAHYRRTEMALRESERKYRLLFENMTTGFALHEMIYDEKGEPADYRFLEVNPAFERMLGIPKAALLGRTVREVLPCTEQYWIEVFGKVARGGEATAYQNYWRELDKHFDTWAFSPERDRFAVVFSDITERKRAEEIGKRHTENLAALRMIDTAINSSLDLHITLSVLLQQTLKQLAVDAACVLLFSPHSQMLEYAAGQGFLNERITSTGLRLGQGYAGQVALERKSRIIPDIAATGVTLDPTTLIEMEEFKAYVAVPLIAKGQVKGVLEIYQRSPLHPKREWLEFAEALAGQAAIAIDNAELFAHLQRSHTDLLMAYDTTLEGWSRALDYRDRATEGHSRRVTEMTVRMAGVMGMRDEELLHIRRGALLHDIGKLGVPDSILLKTSPLTDEEWAIMRQHPHIAFKLLSPIHFLRNALDIPYCHHEKWDGSGYPRGLKGDEIPIAARLFSVVDVWDALRSDRPYRPAWSDEQVREYISSHAGSDFDPKIVDIFLSMQW